MQTDWVLIKRLADELKERLRGARVDDAGMLDDGRIGIQMRRSGARLVVAIDLYASPPLVTLESRELGIGIEPGFVRALDRSLRGMILQDVAARHNDRLLRLSFASRSRFNVEDRFDLYVELVPRFGNAVLVKAGTVIAAFKEFSPADNPRRAVQAGKPYELPPLPSRDRTLPSHPPGSVLKLFARLRAKQLEQSGNERIAARRRSIFKRLADRERKLHAELAALQTKRQHAAQRDTLREQGDAIFATLHGLEPAERQAAKDRAAKLFEQYKKLTKSLPHVEARERNVRVSLEAVETMRWEAERASDEDLGGIEDAVAQLCQFRVAPAVPRTPKRRRALLEFRTASGSRIIVGRSPVENADLTFRQARPHDLWFHAQRIPGAHVILSRDDRGPVPDEDIEFAASLAAFHSRAKHSSSVPVDYTLRKHVRKQRAAPPGLVWYTNAKTIVAAPREALAT